MKKLFVLLTIVMLISACKKDYPKDIPQWVKDKIIHCKKTSDCCGHGFHPLHIYEYKNETSIVYIFSGDGEITFDYYGNVLCDYYFGTWTCSPTYLQDNNYKKTREVWSEDPDKCR